jgi:Amidohydrolase family
VTLNAAKQLGIAERTGSIELGKDADFVIWSGPPLATTSRAEQTWIDGRRYFDLESDRRMRNEAQADRQRLTALALKAPRPLAGGAGGASGAGAAGGSEPPAGMARPQHTLAADIGRLGWLDAARALRGEYALHDAWHECTDDGAFVGVSAGVGP